MAVVWQGGAAAVAQVNTFTFAGTWEVGDLIRVTIGSKTWDYAVTSTTIATFLPLFVTAWGDLSATDYPEFAEVTPTSSSPVLTLTAATAGVPFTATLTPLESNGGTADAQTIEGAGDPTTGTVVTASAGPEDWSTAANWSGGAVPADTDDVVIDDGQWSIKYGLSQSSIDLASLTITVQRDGWELGLPEVNEDGTAYPEYRTTCLTLATATAVTVRNVSDRVKLSLGTNAFTANVQQTGGGDTTNSLEALLLKGAHASNVLNVSGSSSVGVAVLGGETATIPTLRVEEEATVRCGTGVTLTTVTVMGGSVETQSNITTLTQRSGTVLHRAGTITTANLTGDASLDYRSSGTLTTLTVGSGASVTFDNDPQSRTVTNCDMWAGASLSAENATPTFSNGIDLNQCTIQDVNLNLHRNVRLTPGSPS